MTLVLSFCIMRSLPVLNTVPFSTPAWVQPSFFIAHSTDSTKVYWMQAVQKPVRPEVCSPAMPARFTFLSCYDCISCSYHLKMIVVQRCYYILMATQLAFLGKPQCWSEMAPICTKCGFGHYAHPGFDLEVVWNVFSADGKVWHFSVSLSLVGLVGRALFTIAGSSCGEDGFKRSANIIVELE